MLLESAFLDPALIRADCAAELSMWNIRAMSSRRLSNAMHAKSTGRISNWCMWVPTFLAKSSGIDNPQASMGVPWCVASTAPMPTKADESSSEFLWPHQWRHVSPQLCSHPSDEANHSSISPAWISTTPWFCRSKLFGLGHFHTALVPVALLQPSEHKSGLLQNSI